MISHRANAQKDTAIEATADELRPIYLRRTPMGIALGCIGAVLILIFIVVSALLACVLYPFIWLSVKSGLLARHEPPLSSEAGQKEARRFRLSDLVPGR
jgi:hypothetical protein